MPTAPVPSKSLLTAKAGPLPVWAWGAGGLGAAWLWSKHVANQTATSTTTTGTAGAAEPTTGAPYYVIENNLPPMSGGTPSAPVPSPTGQPPTSGPPSTTPSPPTNQNPAPVPRPTPTPTPAPVVHSGATTYRVQSGDTLTSIATKARVPGGAAALWAYQLDPKNNSAQQIATLRQRGPSSLFPGETIRIPPH